MPSTKLIDGEGIDFIDINCSSGSDLFLFAIRISVSLAMCNFRVGLWYGHMAKHGF